MVEIDSTKARRDAIVKEYLNAQNSREKWDRRIKELAEEIVDELGVGGRHELDGTDGEGVRVQAPTRTFDDETARKALTADQYNRITEPQPPKASLEKATKEFPGHLVEQCKKSTNKPTVQPLKKRPRN